MAADQGIIDSIANEDTKVGAGGPSHYQLSAMNSHAGLQGAVNAHFAALLQISATALQNGVMISQAATGKIIESLQQMDAIDAMANAVVGQQGAKVAQSTPPETAKP